MEWISVEDRLPEVLDEYYLFGGFTDAGVFTMDKYRISLDGCVNGWNKKSLLWRGYTHWQPLPEPPTELLRSE